MLDRVAEDLERQLERQIHFEGLMDALQEWLDLRHHAAEETFPALDSHEVELLISGKASTYNSTGGRVRQYGPGDAVWPAPGRKDRTASVIADEPCRTAVLTRDTLDWLEQHETQLVLKLYRYLLASVSSNAPEAGGQRNED